MYQISMKKGKETITKSLYPTKEQALAAATQLRLISTRWNHAVRSAECERKNAKPPVWKYHEYIITPPIQV